MRIGELARRAGEYADAAPLRRAGAGAAPADLEWLPTTLYAELRAVAEIRSLADLGFTLEETRPFVECLRAGNSPRGSCPDSIAVYRRKLGEVDGYLARLSQVREELQAQLARALAVRARSTDDPQCEFSRLASLSSQ
jgi:hypothetical protein